MGPRRIRCLLSLFLLSISTLVPVATITNQSSRSKHDERLGFVGEPCCKCMPNESIDWILCKDLLVGCGLPCVSLAKTEHSDQNFKNGHLFGGKRLSGGKTLTISGTSGGRKSHSTNPKRHVSWKDTNHMGSERR